MKGLVQSDVVIPDKENNNEMLKQVQHDSFLYCHSERSEESHNLESPRAQDYDVASYNKLCMVENNSPRNDMHIVIASESEAIQLIEMISNKTKKDEQMNCNKNHVITRKDNEQIMNGLKQSDVVIPNIAHQCHLETLTRICNVHFSSRTNSALSQRERAKGVKSLVPVCLNALVPTKNKAAFTLAEGATHVDMPPTKAKLAFTLAEVLITLGVIGVVAAITVPTLMQKYYEHQTIARLLETSSIIAQAIKSSEEEYGEIAGWGLTQNEKSAKLLFERISPFLKVAIDCGTVDSKGNCFSKENYATLKPNGDKVDYCLENSKYKLSLINGSSISMQTMINARNIQFNIDTNGPSKPNIIGKDLFLFQYDTETRSLIPMGNPNSRYPYKENCNLNSRGQGCAYYVLMFKNMNYLHKK